jgi:hypothetical protein
VLIGNASALEGQTLSFVMNAGIKGVLRIIEPRLPAVKDRTGNEE